MIGLTKRLRDIPANLRVAIPVHYSPLFTKHEDAPTMNTLDAGIAAHAAADRIDALEECLRALLKALVDSDEEGLIEHAAPIQQARALLEDK